MVVRHSMSCSALLAVPLAASWAEQVDLLEVPAVELELSFEMQAVAVGPKTAAARSPSTRHSCC